MSRPVVAIVGRPNVGKSSLFNRILRKRLAVVHAASGVTRDRHYSETEWNGRPFLLVDTGGMVPGSRNDLEKAIFEQSDIAIREADVILFVVDVQTGADTMDLRLAQVLRRAKRPVLLVVNKVDNEVLEFDHFAFYKLGLDDPLPVSATAGRGVAELLDRLVAILPEKQEKRVEGGPIRVALVGRPNVGKSSFINCLLGENRLIVSEIAGTTRDAIDTPFQFEGQDYVLVDTAGLRRRYKVIENIEFYTYLRSERAIAESDIAVVLIDATQGLTSQDQRVLAQVIENRRGVVLCVNKWDLVEKDTHTADRFSQTINNELARNAFIPTLYISALTGQRVTKVLSTVAQVYEQFTRRIPTADLNDFLQEAYARKKPPARKRKFIQLKYVTQSEISPPTFVFFASHPDLIDKSYVRYLSNRLREEFGFEGVPIRLKFRKK